MKLGKRTLLVIAVGIFLIVGIGLWMVWSQRLDEEEQLKEKLTLTQSKLSGIQLEQLSSRQAGLEQQLSQATSQVEAVKAKLAQPIGSLSVTDSLLDIAQAYDVKVIGMTSPGLANDSLEGGTYSVISLNAKVEGDVSNLVSFVTELNRFFTTGAIKSITITIPEITSGKRASADIQLAVYSHQGD